MNMDMLSQLMGQQANEPAGPKGDTSETIQISALALLKMLKHGRAGVPMEVMGLMLGEFVDEYTVRVVDVFAMPQNGTGVSVEAVDAVFQTKMLDMLKQTNRSEMVVGWYHSHPGFGCWLSGVDVQTQVSFEQLHPRSVAVVVDPIQSVRGKVVIDAFRSIATFTAPGSEPRQTTAHIGHLKKPTIQAQVHGLNRQYYSMPISFRKNELEESMLNTVNRQTWTEALHVPDHVKHSKENVKNLEKMLDLAKRFNQDIETDEGKTDDEIALSRAGTIDASKQLKTLVQDSLTSNTTMNLASLMEARVF